MKHRVVITGMGVVAPNGVGLTEFTEAIKKGTSGITFHQNLKDLDFFTALLDDLQIKFEIPEDDLKRIPKDGAFITVSNHPLGGIDGILLLKLLIEKRPDYKISC